jgi:hypothetical protein
MRAESRIYSMQARPEGTNHSPSRGDQAPQQGEVHYQEHPLSVRSQVKVIASAGQRRGDIEMVDAAVARPTSCWTCLSCTSVTEPAAPTRKTMASSPSLISSGWISLSGAKKHLLFLDYFRIIKKTEHRAVKKTADKYTPSTERGRRTTLGGLPISEEINELQLYLPLQLPLAIKQLLHLLLHSDSRESRGIVLVTVGQF